MSKADVGFKPTDQRVYQIDLDRIFPDLSQPRHLLPHDLRSALEEKIMTPADVIEELLDRASQDDLVAQLVLGGKQESLVDEDDEVVEDSGLLALAQSILEVGLRQPLNVYRIDDIVRPDQPIYRLGEGERRFWAHHLLVQQGYEQFKMVRCIVEPLPPDEEIIHQRQEAENAARVDLPAIARARSMLRIKDRLTVEMGTRVPGENTIRLPSQRELQVAVGHRVKSFTGRAIGDRMVRNYLALLNLSPEAQDIVEAAQLTEKQLRPVMRLGTEAERLAMVKQIVEKKLSGRQVLQRVVPPAPRSSSLREISQTSVEQRFEKRLLDAAKTVYDLFNLPQENYDEAITLLAVKAQDTKVRQAIESLRGTLEQILTRVGDLTDSKEVEVSLQVIEPPLTGLEMHLPADKLRIFTDAALTGDQILERLLDWRQNDPVLGSRLEPFFNRVESVAEALRAGEGMALPVLTGKKNQRYPEAVVYSVELGASVYWAHQLLLLRGQTSFKKMHAIIDDEVAY
ncbi:MAG TPA: ParB N-terminal domain-containing protein [Anaerolineae bacterium]|nr:ParB N-terminal domain-containing protein [Anaerolineae bacterium]